MKKNLAAAINSADVRPNQRLKSRDTLFENSVKITYLRESSTYDLLNIEVNLTLTAGYNLVYWQNIFTFVSLKKNVFFEIRGKSDKC